MTLTNEDLKLIMEAGDAGTAWAKGLKAGDRFIGAMPEAKARYANSHAWRLFMHAALDVLDHRTLRTIDGVITECE